VTAPFRLAVQIRDRLYRSGILRARRLDLPVISIGNLTVGGTGKTPLTILLAETFHADGYKPVILSRGYRRKSKGTVIVSRGEGPLVSWQDAGDEPYLMARRLVGKAAVVVGESRYAAGVVAQEEHLGDLFLLDDGFQHRQLHRDVDIVTLDPAEWLGTETLLPMGRWREPKSAITRAHAACVQDIPEVPSLTLPIPQFKVTNVVSGIYFRGEKIRLEELRGKSITAFAGIAKPERFFKTLDGLGLEINQRVSFPDHHSFSDADLRGLHGDVRLTTEKDAVRLEGRSDFFTLRVSANIAELEALKALILVRMS
jgi:tetraacyldisaccharide 4'-kinase